MSKHAGDIDFVQLLSNLVKPKEEEDRMDFMQLLGSILSAGKRSKEEQFEREQHKFKAVPKHFVKYEQALVFTGVEPGTSADAQKLSQAMDTLTGEKPKLFVAPWTPEGEELLNESNLIYAKTGRLSFVVSKYHEVLVFSQLLTAEGGLPKRFTLEPHTGSAALQLALNAQRGWSKSMDDYWIVNCVHSSILRTCEGKNGVRTEAYEEPAPAPLPVPVPAPAPIPAVSPRPVRSRRVSLAPEREPVRKPVALRSLHDLDFSDDDSGSVSSGYVPLSERLAAIEKRLDMLERKLQ